MGSADWMPRNLDKRVEILFPVEDEKLKARVMKILEVQLKDNRGAYELCDGRYVRPKKVTTEFSSQQYFCEEAIKENKISEDDFLKTRLFEPMISENED